MLLKGLHFEIPRFHAQGLAAMGPKPAIETKADKQQIRRVKILLRGEGFAAIERKQQGCGNK